MSTSSWRRIGAELRIRVRLTAVLRVGLATLGGWVVAVSSVLAIVFLAGGERPSGPDIRSLFNTSLGAVALLALFVYLPGLLWLRWFWRGVTSVAVFVAMCAIVLNVPVFVLLATRVMRGTVLPDDAAMFGTIIAVVGAIFGRSMARTFSARSTIQHSLTRSPNP